jgi:hypothetical protein
MEAIVDQAILVLKNRTNLYATQAIDFVTQGDSFQMLKKLNSHQGTEIPKPVVDSFKERVKPKIIRRSL